MSLNAPTFWTGLVVAVVGFFSSFPIFLQGVVAMGASPEEAASAVMAGSVAMGLAAIWMSLRMRIPASVAWSTPGAALLAVSAPDPAGFGAAVGAFMLAGALTILAGFWKPLARMAQAIPTPITQAMLAGVLISICFAPFRTLADAPEVALPILLTWFVVSRVNRLMAVPVTVLVTFGLVLWHTGGAVALPEALVTRPVWVMPVFSLPALIGLGLPLFVVTMATQNIPGVSVLRANGYAPSAKRLFATVGLFSVLSAPLGAAQTCVAAITAMMCSGDDAHPERAERYMAAVWAGLWYCVFGVFAGLVTFVAAQAPIGAMASLAGVALFGVFVGAASSALAEAEHREAAALTFVTTASGVTILGLGGAVWGLLIGCGVWGVQRLQARSTSTDPTE